MNDLQTFCWLHEKSVLKLLVDVDQFFDECGRKINGQNCRLKIGGTIASWWLTIINECFRMRHVATLDWSVMKQLIEQNFRPSNQTQILCNQYPDCNQVSLPKPSTKFHINGFVNTPT